MLGAIAGDVIGSAYEWAPVKTKDFPLYTAQSVFTDDTVLTVAVADALLSGREYIDVFHEYFGRYPGAGFGGHFRVWAEKRLREPYGSYGNGSAMRVSAVAWARDTLDEVLREAERSAAVTHDHKEGIRGAQATAAAVFLARTGATKTEMRSSIERQFGYDLSRTLDEIRPKYRFDVSCQGSVPPSIIAFLESSDYEDAVRNAISLGGDADTMACITGAIAEGAYGLPAEIERTTRLRLDDAMTTVVDAFRQRFGHRK